MLPSDICRTCATQHNNLLPLASCSEKLQELTQIPLLEQGDENLPQHLCADCLAKVENAYAFVEQARKVNRELLMQLRQCFLEETPIDIPIPNAMHQQIKMEMDEEEVAGHQHLDGEEAAATRLELKWQADSEAESEAEEDPAKCKEDEYKPYQLRRSLRKIKQQSDSEPEEQQREEKNELSLSPEQPPKRRRGRPPRVAKLQALNSDGRHACSECGKTFSWYRDMQRHARIHFEDAAFNCPQCGKGFLRKDKYMSHLKSHEKRLAKREVVEVAKEWRFAERLYSSGQLKLIECKLCNLKCQSLKDLRAHLQSHSSKESLDQLSLDQEAVKENFGDENVDIEKVKDLITKDITEGNLDKFCAIVNSHGYELCLSDSDEDLSIENEKPKYSCHSCNLFFKRKHLLIRHTVEEHTQGHSQPKLRCNLCHIGFVCITLYEQHQRSQCNSKFKRYGCRKCPGKFIWLENLEKHDCLQNREEDKQILCCLCDSQLPSLVQLRAHLASHRDGLTGIDPLYQATFFRCYYPNGLACSQSELSSRIVGDFEAQEYSRYYNASLSSGQELDLYDSDTDESDEPGKSQEKPVHTCPLCGESMKRLTNLLEHQQSCHQQEMESFSYSCCNCSERFLCDSLLQQHRRRSCGKSHARFHCQLCHMHFVWQTNYEQHMRVNHPSDKELDQNIAIKRKSAAVAAAKLKCNECDKVFIWPKDLNRHKRMHQPKTASQFECPHCERKFHRKDGLKSHMRVHSEHQQLDKIENDDQINDEKPPSSQILSELSRPHGCKRIQCMICLSQHSKIADLRCHLMTHQFVIRLPPDREQDIVGVSKSLYPEINVVLTRDHLISRIMNDIGKGVELDRFISITNEAGIELSLDSSETDTDTEDESNDRQQNFNRYSCSICQVEVKRKHQLYAHQLEQNSCGEAGTNVCSHCQSRFVSEQLLEHHLRSQCRNNQKRHQCRKCTLRFRWRDNLKLHSNFCHQSDDSILGAEGGELHCKECHRSFKMQKDLTRHMLMHSDTSIYRCRWCARRFYRQANLLQHIERHGISADQLPYAESLLNSYNHPHGQKIIECKVCNINFISIADLRRHLKNAPKESHHDLDSMQNYSITNQLGYELHLDDSETDTEDVKSGGSNEVYTCSMCHLRCARMYELYQHQQAMHRLERIPDGCDQCIFKSVSNDIIDHHKRNQCKNLEKPFKCIKCGYKFMWESNMLIHVQLQHGKTEEEEQIQEQQPMEQLDPVVNSSNSKQMQQIFQCALCPRKYNRKDRLTAHMKKFHSPGGTTNQSPAPSKKCPSTVAASSSSSSSTASPKQPKLFLCAFCGKAVSSSSNLIIHMRRHTGEKPFKCDFCEMAFPRSSDLQCHRRTHTGERPHVCTVCQKGFARSYKLQQHMRIHNGERPYKCTYCEKSFTQSNDLTLHIRRHTGERPYQCGICGERFIQGTALKNHRLQQGHHEPGTPGGLPGEAPPRRTVLQQFSGE